MADASAPDNWTERLKQVRLIIHEILIVVTLVYSIVSGRGEAAFNDWQARWDAGQAQGVSK